MSSQISALVLFFMLPPTDVSKSVHVVGLRTFVKVNTIPISENWCPRQRFSGPIYKKHLTFLIHCINNVFGLYIRQDTSITQ